MVGEGPATLAAPARASRDDRDRTPVLWRVGGERAISICDSLAVAESLHIAILALAGRHFGRDAIPSVLSGRGGDGRPLRASDQHRHKHVLVGVDGSGVIDRLALWVPGGLTDEERAVVVGARLRWVGRFVALTVDPTAEHAAFSVARSWRSLTPYLPFNHVKRSGRNTVEGQILRELVDFRGRIAPIAVTARPWTGRRCRLLRSDGRRDGPPARPLDVRVTFAEPVAGPLVLGRHAHFSLGLMTPAEE